MDIWTACKDRIQPQPLMGELVRMVESQEQIATRSLVDDLNEQALLEEMLENTKPVAPADTQTLHYLLATPFRYPPLKHGSRFGSRWEPSLFYGSKQKTSVLAETAYYRFVFWVGMKAPPPSGHLLTQHTLFGARFNTQIGLRLQKTPFSEYEKQLTHPEDYSATQTLGTSMRNAGIEAFEYRSARDRAHGLNIALFNAKVLASPKPTYQQPWLCETTGVQVMFNSPESEGIHRYALEEFLIDGRFPQPALPFKGNVGWR